MKALQIIEELENNPKLITEKLLELNTRENELNILCSIHDNTTTAIIRVLQHIKLDAIKHTKLIGKLKLSIKDKEACRAELTAIKYFKEGKMDTLSIKYSLDKNKERFIKSAEASLLTLNL